MRINYRRDISTEWLVLVVSIPLSINPPAGWRDAIVDVKESTGASEILESTGMNIMKKGGPGDIIWRYIYCFQSPELSWTDEVYSPALTAGPLFPCILPWLYLLPNWMSEPLAKCLSVFVSVQLPDFPQLPPRVSSHSRAWVI